MPRYDGKNLQVGDRVAFTRTFITSTPGWGKSAHARASRRGTITAIEGGWLAHVTWDDGDTDGATINMGNICKVRSVAFAEEVNRRPA